MRRCAVPHGSHLLDDLDRSQKKREKKLFSYIYDTSSVGEMVGGVLDSPPITPLW